jgi:hypothetical protein
MKEFGGKAHDVAKANVNGNTGSETGVRTVVGIVHDRAARTNYSCRLTNLTSFWRAAICLRLPNPLI